jgi:hypothetical protein
MNRQDFNFAATKKTGEPRHSASLFSLRCESRVRLSWIFVDELTWRKKRRWLKAPAPR